MSDKNIAILLAVIILGTPSLVLIIILMRELFYPTYQQPKDEFDVKDELLIRLRIELDNTRKQKKKIKRMARWSKFIWRIKNWKRIIR